MLKTKQPDIACCCRTLSPQAGFASISQLWKIHCQTSKNHEKITKAVDQSILANLSPNCSYLFDSGKSALLRVFEFLATCSSKRVIGVSAYTCPDIAVAAGQAGFKVLPLECNRNTLEVETKELLENSSKLACVVLSNLYGLVDRSETIPQLESLQVPVIDDASQAGLSFRNDVRVGGGSAIGVYSFGRGKAFCGIGGGLVSVGNVLHLEKIKYFLNTKHYDDNLNEQTCDSVNILFDVVKSLFSNFFERPEWYWIPKKISWLGLGETLIKKPIAPRGLGYVELLHIYAQLEHGYERSKIANASVADYQGAFEDIGICEPYLRRNVTGQVMIRYPLIFQDEKKRDQVINELKSFGVSASYPKTLSEYPELNDVVIRRETPEARFVSRHILTLPTHKYVNEDDRKFIIKKIRETVSTL